MIALTIVAPALPRPTTGQNDRLATWHGLGGGLVNKSWLTLLPNSSRCMAKAGWTGKTIEIDWERELSHEPMQSTLFDKTFRDGQGTVVIAQPPNLPLWIWIVSTLLKFVFTQGPLFEGLDAIAFGSLFTWAWLELFDGVNYFRRALGAIVLIGALASRIHV